MPCAIVQFVNKIVPPGSKHGPGIGEADIEKFNSMKALIGMSIQTANEMARTIGVGYKVADTMKDITGIMQQEEQNEKENDEADIVGNLFEKLGGIKEQNNKLQ